MTNSKSTKNHTDDKELRILIEDAKHNKDSMETLLEMFMPLIKKASKSYLGDNIEDTICEGIEAFLKSLERYPKGSPIPFPHYCKRAVYSHIRHYTSKEINRKLLLISIDSPVKGCEDITLEDTLTTGELIEETLLKKLNYLELLNAIETLDYIEKETLLRHYILLHPLKKIAKDTGYSYRGIKYVKTRALEKLRSILTTKE
ncbi:MAG: sigma-70 family RNA polymerase sigma factor [Clostridium sp.]